MTTKIAWIPLAVGLLVASVTGASAAAPRFIYDVIDLGAKMNAARINSSGAVVGTVQGEGQQSRAFLYAHGAMRDLGTLGGSSASACAINDAGDIVGTSQMDGETKQRGWVAHGFLFTNGAMHDVYTLDAGGGTVTGFVSAVGLNNAGEIAGSRKGVDGWIFSRGKVRSLGTLVAQGVGYPVGKSIDASGHATEIRSMAPGWVEVRHINASGAVVGMAATRDGHAHAFLYAGGKIQDLGTLGGDSSRAECINDAGAVVGHAFAADQHRHAFLYVDGKMHDLGLPRGFEHGVAHGINAGGQIVGGAENIKGGSFLRVDVESHAFRYDHDQWHDLNDEADLAAVGCRELIMATAINDAGQIICQGMAADGYHAYLLTPVTQPGSPTLQQSAATLGTDDAR